MSDFFFGSGDDSPLTSFNDTLPPDVPDISSKTQTAEQDTTVINGRTKVTLSWGSPSISELIGGEFVGVVSGVDEILPMKYGLPASVLDVWETDGSSANTTLSQAAFLGDETLTVASSLGSSPGDTVRIEDTTTGTVEFYEVVSEAAGVVTLETRVLAGNFPVGSVVDRVTTVTLMTLTTDYTVSALGLHIIGGQFTTGFEVRVSYNVPLSDLGGYTILRNPTILASTIYNSVNADPTTESVSDAVAKTRTSFTDTMQTTEGGETWVYYLYAKDTSGNRSKATTLSIETLPSLVQNVVLTGKKNRIDLAWDALADDPNTDGFNIYRSSGTLVAANLKQINDILIPKTQTSFIDGQEGVDSGDRVSEGTVAFPINGFQVSYFVEGVDTTTNWDTGTQNTTAAQNAILVATKVT